MFTRATVRLFNVGHTSGTFLTDEFGYQVARFKLLMLRWVVYLAAFLLPGALVAYSLQFDPDDDTGDCVCRRLRRALVILCRSTSCGDPVSWQSAGLIPPLFS